MARLGDQTMPAQHTCRAVELLILVLSREEDHQRRIALRHAHSPPTDSCVAARYFILAKPPPANDSSTAAAAAAAAVSSATVHGDEVTLPYAESYDALSHKVLRALAWSLLPAAPRFTYLLKSDDDAYVCTGGLVRWLREWESRYRAAANANRPMTRGGLPRLYAGVQLQQRCIGKELLPLFRQLASPRLRAPRGGPRGCRRAWRFPRDTMDGAGYILSRPLVGHVVTLAHRLQPVPSAEDATVSLLMDWRPTNGSTAPAVPPALLEPAAIALRAALEPVVRGSGPPQAAAAYTVESLGSAVVPFANRRDPWRIVEKLGSAEAQARLVGRRCERAGTLVVHKLTVPHIALCAERKKRDTCDKVPAASLL